MKILGITQVDETEQALYMKPDSALLVGGKPFFLPHFSQQIVARPCLVIRINRLGRCIEQRFAHRYYDGVAMGLNLQAADLLTPPYSLDRCFRATAFDNSLVVGEWMEQESVIDWQIGTEAESKRYSAADLVCSVDEAISRVSQYVTVRMGDMLAIDFKGETRLVHTEEEWWGRYNEERLLYCKIK